MISKEVSTNGTVILHFPIIREDFDRPDPSKIQPCTSGEMMEKRRDTGIFRG
jgi:hypothetical protein